MNTTINTNLYTYIEGYLEADNVRLYKYLREYVEDHCRNFVKESYRICPNTMNQARAIFTTICMLEDIEADTFLSDNMLLDLYSLLEHTDFTQEEFENFMLEDIV